MTRGQYCPTQKGIELLNKATHTRWQAFEPNQIASNMCVATILPSKTEIAHLHPILDQPGYTPIGFNPAPSKPELLVDYLRTTGQHALTILPSVKYDLDGVEVSMKNALAAQNGIWLIEGSVKLNGEMVIKPTEGLNYLRYSINARNYRFYLEESNRLKNEFLTSLKPTGFVLIGKPMLTIGSTFSDKISMISNSVQLTLESPLSSKIVADMSINHYEIRTSFNMTLEIHISCQFLGKGTFYPAPPTGQYKSQPATHSLKTEIVWGAGITGTILLGVFVAPEIIAAIGLIAGALLLEGG